MRIAIDPQASLPVYRQIEQALSSAIRTGALKAGTRLSSTRELAAELGVSRLTVESAYEELVAAGLIEGRAGSGSYVLPRTSPLPPLPAEASVASRRWPRWQESLAPFEMEPFSSVSRYPYDLGSGMGARDLMPASQLTGVIKDLIRKEGAAVLGYEEPQGYASLRASIAEILSVQGQLTHPDKILVCSGSQQAISLSVQALTRPGDLILVESPCYGAALKLFRMLGLRIKALPMDAEGLCIEPLETLLQRTRPKVLYCMPSFQNPSGACLSMRRRKDLVALAARHNFAILEDDYVGDLRYDGRALPSLRTLDQDGTVIYTGTFSKMLAPGLRIGFLVAEGPVLKHLCAWKRNLELSGPPLLQRALQAYVSVGLYRRYLKRSRSVYRQRRDAMATALTRELGHSAQWKVPQGGLFFWVKLRRKRKGLKLLEEARSQGLNFALGDDFFVTKPEHTWLRLNFAANEIPISERAVAILGKLLR